MANIYLALGGRRSAAIMWIYKNYSFNCFMLIVIVQS